VLDRGTSMSTVYLRPLPGSDVAVLKGIMKRVLELDRAAGGGVIDHAFVESHTKGFDSFVADLDATSYESVEAASGLSRAEFETAARVYADSKATIICWAMGLTQQRNAVDNVIACSNLALLKGNIGKPGAGLCPVRGHSNVQGDRTVGITNRPRTMLIDGLRRVFGFEPPKDHGLDTLESLQAMERGEVDVFLAMGGNLAQAAPDSARTHAALSRPKLGVHIATKPNRTHLVGGRATLLLPCLARSERDVQSSGAQFVTVEDSMSLIHRSQGSLSPAGEALLSEPAIAARIGKALFGNSGGFRWDDWENDYASIRDAIESVLPIFEHYNDRVRGDGFHLPHTAARREWKTPSGKAEFRPTPTPDIRLRDGELRLMTIRSHDQYNTTVYGRNDRYRGIANRRNVLFMNGDDMDARHLMPGDEVVVTSTDDAGIVRTQKDLRVVRYDIPRGACASYFPESNVLIPIESASAVSNQPVSKMIPVRVERVRR
jgi:molybdopterin-dependent oxidoreductase alpha subunit